MEKHELGESVDVFLARRERELVHQIARLKGELSPRENELIAVRQAMAAIGLQSDASAPSLPPTNSNALIEPPDAFTFARTNMADAISRLSNTAAHLGTAMLMGSQPTIKQLIVRALTDHFKDGASPAELRDYFKDAYGREIDRNSIGPQLTRLREDGVVEQPPQLAGEGRWRLRQDGGVEVEALYHGVEIISAPRIPRPADASKVTDGAETPINRRPK